MSLDPITSGLDSGLPVNKDTETATSTVQSTAQKPLQQAQETTKPLTDPIIPGEFPPDEGPRNNAEHPLPEINFRGIWASFAHWAVSLIPQAFDGFEWLVTWLLNRYLPPPKQAAMYELLLKRPIASTFLVCQAICCGVPLLVFLVGVALFAIVAVVLWAVLALLILGPILLVASMMGIWLWGWGWVLYGLLKWVDQQFLGGMITRFWLPKVPGEEQWERDEGKGEDETETGGDEKKDNRGAIE